MMHDVNAIGTSGTRLLASVALVVLGLSGCGGGGETSGVATEASGDNTSATQEPAGSPSAPRGGAVGGICAALTLEELSTAAGEPFVRQGLALPLQEMENIPGLFNVETGEDAQACVWTSEDGLHDIHLATISAAAYDVLVARREPEQGFEELMGIGDRAYAAYLAEARVAHAVRGDASVLVVIGVEDVEQDAAVELLQAALARL